LKLRFLLAKTLKLIFFLPLFVFAQSTPATIYVESFRQGEARVVEEKFDVKLSSQEKAYTERIKDSHGSDRYVFSVTPFTPGGDTSITSWQVKLTDLNHRFYDNILVNSLQEDAANDPKNQLWQLNPSNFANVPIRTKRIIKVDGFYVVLQVKSYHFTPIDSPYLDSMNLAVELTNSDPRIAPDAPK
jgi:hypothetical protein